VYTLHPLSKKFYSLDKTKVPHKEKKFHLLDGFSLTLLMFQITVAHIYIMPLPFGYSLILYYIDIDIGIDCIFYNKKYKKFKGLNIYNINSQVTYIYLN